MGKPVKFSDKKKAWFTRSPRAGVRVFRELPVRRRFLIVCEGKKTEPNYFEAFRDRLHRNQVEVEVDGTGANTLTVVQRALELRSQREACIQGEIDETWVVIDRDSFPPHDFDNAISMADSHGVECAWSNEAFELWFLLHFEDIQTPMSRDLFKGRLTKHLGVTYTKNMPDIYERLIESGGQTFAIDRAARLFKKFSTQGLPPSSANPCTTVYSLVCNLNEYINP